MKWATFMDFFKPNFAEGRFMTRKERLAGGGKRTSRSQKKPVRLSKFFKAKGLHGRYITLKE